MKYGIVFLASLLLRKKSTQMKIRIQGNSIRFRLKQKEVRNFQQLGEIKEEICFGNSSSEKLSFVLKTALSEKFEIVWKDNMITVLVPASLSTRWTDTDLVGIEEEVHTSSKQVVKVLIEKDFKCLDGVGVDNEDAYPNPNEYC